MGSEALPASLWMSPGPERSEGGMEGVKEGRLGPNRKIEVTNWGRGGRKPHVLTPTALAHFLKKLVFNTL